MRLVRLSRKPTFLGLLRRIAPTAARALAPNTDQVITEMSRLTFVDIGKAINEDGSLKPIHDMDEDTRRAIASIEVTTLTSEGAPFGHLSKIKLVDKLRALELLGKHLGSFNDKLTIAGDAENPLVVLLKQVQSTALKPVPLHVIPGREAARYGRQDCG